jgi:hypothetical protein
MPFRTPQTRRYSLHHYIASCSHVEAAPDQLFMSSQRTFREIMFLQDLVNHENIIR